MSCFPFIFLDFCPPPIKDTRDSTLQTNRGTPIALRTTFFFIVTVSTPAAKKCGIELPFRDGDGSPNGGGEGQEGIGAPAEGVDKNDPSSAVSYNLYSATATALSVLSPLLLVL